MGWYLRSPSRQNKPSPTIFSARSLPPSWPCKSCKPKQTNASSLLLRLPSPHHLCPQHGDDTNTNINTKSSIASLLPSSPAQLPTAKQDRHSLHHHPIDAPASSQDYRCTKNDTRSQDVIRRHHAKKSRRQQQHHRCLPSPPLPPLQSHLITLVARHAQLFWGSWLPLPQPSQKWANSSTLYLYRLLQRGASPGLIKSNPPSYRWASPCLPLQWAEFCQALDVRVLSFGDGDGSFGFRKTAASSIKWNEVLMPFIVMLLGGGDTQQ